MARRIVNQGYRRNTAPMWKKLAIVVSAPVAVGVAVGVLDMTQWSFIAFLPAVLGIAAAAIWLTSKALGVHVGLHSWD